ncbi:hypothetical protein DY218_27465 [Streptomyces triticagri]|uniref:Uncharacterized protein n=1 Tax=Streptomyces triticagri TaxID=2293568 RepID=A0A372LYK9_9ACTN|nr:hypothetical protein [Streptomyces triticagri]RFU83649.1 hypothetical protein DY218_27465 [Streptomyces triticagri]
MRSSTLSLHEQLTASAQGDWGLEAAVDLLAAHGRWLPTLDQHGWITYGSDCFEDCEPGCDTAHTTDIEYAAIDWTGISGALLIDRRTRDTEERDYALLVGSGSERGMLQLACSIAAGTQTSVRGALSSLDSGNLRLALRAIMHAARGRAYAEEVFPTLADDVCEGCGRPGEHRRDWHPRGDRSRHLVVCMDCGNSWIVRDGQGGSA